MLCSGLLVGVRMRIYWLAMLALGCADMPTSDNPLEAVVVEEPAAEAPPPPAIPPAPETPSETDEVIEEVAKVAKHIAEGGDPIEAKAKAKAKAKMAKNKAKARKAKARRRMMETTRSVAGPIKVVTSIPQASPPRAILSLPSGKEIVVKPGEMVPSAGLVVLAIEADKVEISWFETQGNRATVHNEILTIAK